MRICLVLVPAFLLLCACSASPAPKEPKDAKAQQFDWPQWRGPNRDGISKETGLLKKWPDAGPTKLWTTSGLGGGYSTPSVAQGRIFGMSYRSGEEYIWALDASTGEELWSTKIASASKVGYGEGSRSTPTIDGDFLYCVGVGGDIVCAKIATGEVVWQKNYSKEFGGRMMSGWGFSESPLIDGDWVICTPGGNKAALAALNKKDGSTVWTTGFNGGGGSGYSSVMKAEIGSNKIYLTLLGKSGGVVAVNAKDGAFLWNYNKIANGTANIPTVVVRGDMVFCSTGYGDGGTAVLKLSDGGKKYEEVKYHSSKSLQNHHGGMILVDDHVFLGHGHNNGIPACAKFSTGEIIWKEDSPPRGCSRSAAVSYADGMLYFRYESGTIALIEANPKKYNLVSTFRIPDPSGKPSWPHPVIANGKLLIRDQDKLHCFDIKVK